MVHCKPYTAHCRLYTVHSTVPILTALCTNILLSHTFHTVQYTVRQPVMSFHNDWVWRLLLGDSQENRAGAERDLLIEQRAEGREGRQ